MKSDVTASAAIGIRWPLDRLLKWATWRNTLLLVLLILVLRVIYLIWLCPYELVADEAHYWEWSRHPDLSYYSKGPGVAGLIFISTSLFGVAEWSVRLPAAIAGAVATLLLVRLAIRLSAGDERVGFFTAVVFCLIPIYHAVGQFMTIDGPYLACWILSAWTAWWLAERVRQARSTWHAWLALGLVLGLAFLFKYTILLLIPGLIAYGMIDRKNLAFDRFTPFRCLAGLIIFLLVISPVLIWNHSHGWPTVSHLLGNLNVQGGDMPVRDHWVYKPIWTLEYLGSILVLGPFGALLLISTLCSIRRHASSASICSSSSLRFAVCCAIPILLFYFLMSIESDVEANWPMAAYSTLAILIAQDTVARITGIVPALSITRSWIRLWRGFLVFTPVLAVLMLLPPRAVAAIPWLGENLPLHRVNGQKELATRIHHQMEVLRSKTGREPFAMADSYGQASLLAYYLPGHPVVYSAASRLGGRKSAYDFFPDTDLEDPRLLHRPTVLYGSYHKAWRDRFVFASIRQTDEDRKQIFSARDFQGPRVKSGKGL